MRQDDALLDHLSAAQNIELGAVAAGRLGAAGQRLVDSVVESLELGALAERRTTTLSGGQRRRVYLAQTLSTDADMLLLDEPFNGLGWRHERLARTIIQARQASQRSTFIVSHDLGLLATIATTILLIDNGVHVGWINPGEEEPSHAETAWAETIGISNIVDVDVLRRAFVVSGSLPPTGRIAFWRDWIEAGATTAGVRLEQRPEISRSDRFAFAGGECVAISEYRAGGDRILELQVAAGDRTELNVLAIRRFVELA